MNRVNRLAQSNGNGHIAREELALLGGPKALQLTYPPYPVIGSEEVAAVVKVMMNRELSAVRRAGAVKEMEDSYAEFFGAKHAHATNSGTSAISSALFAVGVGPGSEVLTANHTWISGIMAICHAGGTPVFCDIKK